MGGLWTRRAAVLAALALGVVTSAVGMPREPAVAAAAQATTYTNPNPSGVGTGPFTLKVGSTYYRYTDGFDYGAPFIIPILTSTDLATWTWIGNAMAPTDVGAWSDGSAGGNFTGPSLLHVPGNPADSQFVLYFTGEQSGTGGRCIGYATADSPAGPFEGADTPLVCPTGAEAIDPSPRPVAGAEYQQIVFRRTGDAPGIYNQVLREDGLAVHDDLTDPYLVFSADAAVWPEGPDYWEGGVVERPSVVPGDGATYHLVFSGTDAITGSRAVGSVTCQNAFGLVANCRTAPPDGGLLFGSTPDVTGPGRAQAFSDGSHLWLSYDATAPGGVYTDKLCIAGGRLRTNAPTLTAQPLARSSDCAADIPGAWAGSWTVALGGAFPCGGCPPFEDVTLRQMVHTSIGGSALRVRISNLNETSDDLVIADASVAVAADDDGDTSAVQPATLRPLTFGGADGVAVPPGGEVISDPVELTVPEDHDLAVSLHLPGPEVTRTGHVLAMETSHVGHGNLVDHAGDATPPEDVFTHSTEAQSLFVSGVDVRADNPAGSVVILGDSLTDHIPEWGGPGSPDYLDTERRWPDRLVDRLAATGPVDLGIMNHGHIAAPLIPSGADWMDQRILSRGAITTVVVAMGQNDVWWEDPRTSTEIIAALSQIIQDGHAAGLRVVGTTIAPYAWRDRDLGGDGDPGPGPCYDNPISPEETAMEVHRQAVNDWVRQPPPGAPQFDAVIDLDATLREAPPLAGPTPYDARPELTHLTATDCVHLTVDAHDLVAAAVDPAQLVG